MGVPFFFTFKKPSIEWCILWQRNISNKVSKLQPTASRGCNKILTNKCKTVFLILVLAITLNLSFAHHYICLHDHRHTSLLFLWLMTIHAQCNWKEIRGDLGWERRTCSVRVCSILDRRKWTHCWTRWRMFGFHNSTKLVDRVNISFQISLHHNY